MKKQDTFEKLMAELEEICPSFNIPFKGNWVDDAKLRKYNQVLQKAREIADDPISFVTLASVELPDSARPHARVIIETPGSFLLTEDLIYEFHDLFLLCDTVVVRGNREGTQYLLGVEHIWRE